MSDMFDRLSNLSPKRLALLAMELQERLDESERERSEPIAIVGMGCRLPGAPNLDAYWQMLLDGVDAIREIPASRWDVDEFYDPDPDTPGKMATRWAGTLDDIDRFEPQLFGISPREAITMDPQQRLLLEVAWETLEHAGIATDALHGSSTGVYVGVCNSDYAQMLMEGDENALDMYLSTGNAGSVASGRLSYVLGLQGPAMTVDTACSSSLVAVDLAVQALRSGSCRMALAGGVNVILSPKTTVTLSRAKMMASDGRCKSFDASGDGFVRGEGCGLVALKRLSHAQADGDRVLAVIRGSAVNQDGRSNGLTAPNGPSQAAVIRAAVADAGIDPTAVGYIETHGTGTPLGDPIEAQALGAALGEGRGPSNRLMIGSAKSNLGHLESAAGIAGLIKLILTVQHEEIPPLLHLENPNPYIPWHELPLDVPTTRTPWLSDSPRIGGVSSFGFSGTNAHVVVQAAPAPAEQTDEPDRRTAHMLTLSARTESALFELATQVGETLAASPELSMADLERTLNRGRSHLACRLAVVAADARAASSAIVDWVTGSEADSVVVGAGPVGQRPPEIAFLFTGHGAQYPNMGRLLYDTNSVFRDTIERCEQLLDSLIDVPLRSILYDETRSETLLESMAYAQPAVFAVEYAMAELWRSWGVRPSVVAGHSVGEYVAAVVAGAMSLDDGIRLVAARGRLMASLPPDGAMATVFASEERVSAALDDTSSGVSIAAVNGPQSVALSGTDAGLAAVLDELHSDGVEVRPLAIPVAAHSPQIDPILDEFEAVAATVTFARPTIDVISGMTGELAAGDDLITASYWRRHLRQPVRFADAFRAIHGRGVRTFVEVGPHPTLLNMARHIVPERECTWLPSLRSGRDEWDQVLTSAAELYVAGANLDWTRVDSAIGSVVTLPSYPFERERYWSDTVRRRSSPLSSGDHPLLGARLLSPPLTDAVFENSMGATWPAFLDHHRIHGTALLPSPAYLEMALAAGWALDGVRHVVERFEIREGLVLPDDGERIVQLVVGDDGERTGDRDFEVFSRLTGESVWTLHATGRLTPGQQVPAEADSLDVDELRARCTEHIDGVEYYERLADLGLEFGSSFRGVTDIWRRDGEALGRVSLPPALLDESSRFGIHPAMLDACFHVLGAAMGSLEETTYLLVGADEFRLHRTPGPWLWNHTLMRSQPENAPEGMISGDIRLYDEDGTLVAEALGLHLRVAGRDALLRTTRQAAHDWTYQVVWQNIDTAPKQESDSAEVEHWTVVGDAAGLGAALAQELTNRGIANRHVDDLGESRDTADRSTRDSRRNRVIHVGSTIHDDAAAGAIEALRSVQSHLADDSAGELWIVTHDAQPVGEYAVDPNQSPIWGIGRVAAVEYPERWGGLVDLARGSDPRAEARNIVDVVLFAGIEDQFAVREGKVTVPRLVRTRPGPTAPVVWRQDAAYLVTGGLGGLGLQLLEWLATQGAGTIVLTGRHGLPERARWDDAVPGSRAHDQIAAIRRAEDTGASVVVVVADVADQTTMTELFARFGRDLPALAGLVHVAAALGNAGVASMTDEELGAMFRPKVTGTAILHELTRALELDFFAMFSSTTALWGSRDLAHYAAANQYLDSMAHHRHALGLPALAFDWGTWDEMRVASNDERAQVAQSGMHPMPTEEALAAFGALLGCPDLAQVAVASVDWDVLKPVYEARRIRPFLASVAPARTASRSGRSAREVTIPQLANQLADSPPQDRREMVIDYLRDEVARSLGVGDPRSIDVEQGLFEMGMDSLMSVELKSRIETALGTDLPSTLTFNYPNIAALAGYVIDDVLAEVLPDVVPAGLAVANAATETGEPSEPSADAGSGDDMSEDQLAEMLADRLSKLQQDER